MYGKRNIMERDFLVTSVFLYLYFWIFVPVLSGSDIFQVQVHILVLLNYLPLLKCVLLNQLGEALWLFLLLVALVGFRFRLALFNCYCLLVGAKFEREFDLAFMCQRQLPFWTQLEKETVAFLVGYRKQNFFSLFPDG